MVALLMVASAPKTKHRARPQLFAGNSRECRRERWHRVPIATPLVLDYVVDCHVGGTRLT
jgi:hypothetical protein